MEKRHPLRMGKSGTKVFMDSAKKEFERKGKKSGGTPQPYSRKVKLSSICSPQRRGGNSSLAASLVLGGGETKKKSLG